MNVNDKERHEFKNYWSLLKEEKYSLGYNFTINGNLRNNHIQFRHRHHTHIHIKHTHTQRAARCNLIFIKLFLFQILYCN